MSTINSSAGGLEMGGEGETTHSDLVVVDHLVLGFKIILLVVIRRSARRFCCRHEYVYGRESH